MSNKILLEPSCPVTQTAEAVKTLITYHNHGLEPAEMPAFYRLTGDMVLVQSNKKDVYYVVTPKSCSCPSHTYRGGPCKHQRKFYPTDGRQEVLQNSAKAMDGIRPTGKWANGANGPVAVF